MRRQDPLLSLRLPEPAPSSLAELQSRLQVQEDEARNRAPSAWSYLVITPLGLPERAWLARAVTAHGVSIARRLPLHPWSTVSSALYVRNPASLRRAALFEAAWRQLIPEDLAEAWAIDPRAHAAVAMHKHSLRAQLRNLEVAFGPRSTDRGVLHAFHLSDEADAAADARIIEAFADRA